MNKWQELLTDNSSYNDAEAAQIVTNLQAGRWLFTGVAVKDKDDQPLQRQPEPIKQIRLDVTDSGQLEVVNNEAGFAFGKDQLGVLLKISFYEQYLKEQNNTELLEKLNNLSGFTDTEAIIATIEKQYPEVIKLAEKKLEENWQKLGDKKVLESILLAVLQEDKNPIDLRKLISSLEIQKKTLQSSLSQKFKNLVKKNRGDKQKMMQEKRTDHYAQWSMHAK